MSLTLVGRFLRGFGLSPEGPALRVGDDVVTYREVHERALLWAGSLRAGGALGAVGVLAGKSVTAYVGLLAVLYAGGTVVPLQPNFPAELTRRMMRVAGVETLIVDDRGLAVLPEVVGDGTRVRVLDT
ncbi:AMP-binding protein, partial [Streptomyces wedmorensis]